MSLPTWLAFAIVSLALVSPTMDPAAAQENGGAAENEIAGQTGVLPPQMDKQATYAVDFRVAITPKKGTKKLRVWVPIPPTDAIQKPSASQFATFPREVAPRFETEPKYGNKFAYFEFDRPAGAVLVEHHFNVSTQRVRWNLDPTRVQADDRSDESLTVYRNADPREADAIGLEQIVAQFDRQRAGSVTGLLSAMNWVDRNMKYDHSIASLSGNPAHALEKRTGHCSDYHGLCSAMARRIGYPSRIAYGMQMFDKGSPSHCKLEVHLPPYGWVPFDLSETQKSVRKVQDSDVANKAKWVDAYRARTQAGYRENTWIKMTQGVHYELAPRASKPVNLVRTIYAEADGEALPEPDPSDPNQQTFAWMTMHRVDVVSGEPERF